MPGGGGGNSNELEICGETMWQAADGTYTGPGCFPSTLAACPAVLPVELTIFKQDEICSEEAVCPSWQTASERINQYFQLERSNNGETYENVERVYSKAPGGNSKTPNEYSCIDFFPYSGVSYYRLRQVDLDGAFSNSPLIIVNRSNKAEAQIKYLQRQKKAAWFTS